MHIYYIYNQSIILFIYNLYIHNEDVAVAIASSTNAHLSFCAQNHRELRIFARMRQQPSDHVPIVAQFRTRSQHHTMREVAKEPWHDQSNGNNKESVWDAHW